MKGLMPGKSWRISCYLCVGVRMHQGPMQAIVSDGHWGPIEGVTFRAFFME